MMISNTLNITTGPPTPSSVATTHHLPTVKSWYTYLQNQCQYDHVNKLSDDPSQGVSQMHFIPYNDMECSSAKQFKLPIILGGALST